jgi:hypothetical protein
VTVYIKVMLNIYSSVSLAEFQIPYNYMWQVATVFDSTVESCIEQHWRGNTQALSIFL